MRLAKMSFDMWGALSPLNSKSPPGTEETPTENEDNETKDDNAEQLNTKRTMSQAELESTLYKVSVFGKNH